MGRYVTPQGVVITTSEVAARAVGYRPAGTGPSASPAGGAEGEDGYEGMTVAQLREIIRERNEGRDTDARLHLWQDKSDLIADLRADDDK